MTIRTSRSTTFPPKTKVSLVLPIISFFTLIYCSSPGTAKDMDRQLPIFPFFGWPLFVKGFCMAKVLGIYGTTRCQIKDMDIVFPQVPLNPVLAKWFGYCDSMKYGSFQRFFRLHFSDKIAMQKLFLKTVSIEDQSSQRLETNAQ